MQLPDADWALLSVSLLTALRSSGSVTRLSQCGRSGPCAVDLPTAPTVSAAFPGDRFILHLGGKRRRAVGRKVLGVSSLPGRARSSRRSCRSGVASKVLRSYVRVKRGDHGRCGNRAEQDNHAPPCEGSDDCGDAPDNQESADETIGPRPHLITRERSWSAHADQ